MKAAAGKVILDRQAARRVLQDEEKRRSQQTAASRLDSSSLNLRRAERDGPKAEL